MAEIIDKQQELTEQVEQIMSPEQRNRLIEQYDRSIEDALKEGRTDMAAYYREKARLLKEARIQEQQEYWANKKQALTEEQKQLQKEIQQANIERRTPTYGLPTTERGWLDKAKTEFKNHGESWYYRQCMNNAAKCHVEGKY